MTDIRAGFLAPSGWDQNIITGLLDGTWYPHGLDIQPMAGYPNNVDGCCLVLPGKYWHDQYDQINEALARYDWVLAFRTSDEEDWFDIHRVEHPNLRWWVQYSRTDRDYGEARLMPVGFTPHFNSLPADPPHKDLDVALSAQCTHVRRKEAFAALERIQSTNTHIQPTDGFTQGLAAPEYVEMMLRAKIAPAPSGAFSPDSFRVWEALESHAVPIADDISPVYPSRGYWQRLFPGDPFPVLTDYESLPGYVGGLLSDWPRYANRMVAWWMRAKRDTAHALRADLEELGAL